MKNKIILKLNTLSLYILQNSNYKWNSSLLMDSCKTNKYFIYKYLKLYEDKIDFENFSSNKKLTPYIITKYINKNWNFNILSKNSNITEKFITKYINKPWNYRKLSNNKNISLEFVIKHINKPWNFSELNCITQEFLENYIINKIPDDDIDYFLLTNHKNISLEFITKYINKPWNFAHSKITLDILKLTNYEYIIKSLRMVEIIKEDNNYDFYEN